MLKQITVAVGIEVKGLRDTVVSPHILALQTVHTSMLTVVLDTLLD